jgi:hypothetical protein
VTAGGSHGTQGQGRTGFRDYFGFGGRVALRLVEQCCRQAGFGQASGLDRRIAHVAFRTMDHVAVGYIQSIQPVVSSGAASRHERPMEVEVPNMVRARRRFFVILGVVLYRQAKHLPRHADRYLSGGLAQPDTGPPRPTARDVDVEIESDLVIHLVARRTLLSRRWSGAVARPGRRFCHALLRILSLGAWLIVGLTFHVRSVESRSAWSLAVTSR